MNDEKEIYNKLTGALREARNQKMCLAARFDSGKCDVQLIGSHSIAKSTILKSVQVAAKVYTWNVPSFTLVKENGKFIPIETVISKASVFGGFCQYHDRVLFNVIDKQIQLFDDEVALQLHYRAICFEYFQKHSVVESSKRSKPIRDKEFRNIPDFVQDNANGNVIGKLYLLNEMEVCENAYKTLDRSAIHAIVFEFDVETPVVCACGWIPEHSIYGDPLFNITSNKRAPYIGFTLGNNGNGKSYFALTYTKNDSCIDEFIETISEKKDSMLDVAIAFCLQNSENSYMCPTWWNNLNKKLKDEVVKSFNGSFLNMGMTIPKDVSKSKFIINKFNVLEYKINA